MDRLPHRRNAMNFLLTFIAAHRGGYRNGVRRTFPSSSGPTSRAMLWRSLAQSVA